MKTKRFQKTLAFLLALAMVFNLMPLSAFAVEVDEMEAYLDATYPLSQIIKYKTLSEDEAGRLVIPLKETSGTLKTDSTYKAEWNSDSDLVTITTGAYSTSAKFTHPTADVGDTIVTLTLTLKDKSSDEEVASRDYQLLIKAQLPVYDVTFQVTDQNSGEEISDAEILVQDPYVSGGEVRPGNKLSLKDSDLCADYAKEAISKVQGAGIIRGKENNLFAPKEQATRGEAAAMLARFAQR